MTLPEVPVWVGWLISILGIVFGGGGIAALVKVWSDKRQGIVQLDIAGDDAEVARWKLLLETQTKELLQPMKEDIAAQKLEIADLRKQVAAMEAENNLVRTKYWRAISYIRVLHTWIARNMPDVEQTIPEPPADLAADI